MIKVKNVRNPHYSSAPPALLINREDLERNIEKIRELPKYSDEERERMREYARRSRLRDKLGFLLPEM